MCLGPFPSFAFMPKEVLSIVFFKLFIKIKILLLWQPSFWMFVMHHVHQLTLVLVAEAWIEDCNLTIFRTNVSLSVECLCTAEAVGRKTTVRHKSLDHKTLCWLGRLSQVWHVSGFHILFIETITEVYRLPFLGKSVSLWRKTLRSSSAAARATTAMSDSPTFLTWLAVATEVSSKCIPHIVQAKNRSLLFPSD